MKAWVGVLIGLVVILGVVLLVTFARSRTPKYKWYPEYTKKSEQPYGLKLFYDLLKDVSPKINTVSTDEIYTLDTTETNSNLVIVDSYLELDSMDIVHMLDFVKQGNKVLIATDEAPLYVLQHFVPGIDSSAYDEYEKTAISVGFISKRLPYEGRLLFHHQYLKKPTPIQWSGYSHDHFREHIAGESIVPISFFNDSVINCFYAHHGKGKIIVHTNPAVFTNYNLVQEDGFKNANNILAYMNNGPVHWYEYQLPDFNGNNGGYENNPLKFLFSHYTLRTGWYVLIASILLFLLFRSKREQRIIPVMYKHQNASIEYAKAVGSLYYKRKSHQGIANELYAAFMADIRARYNIITSARDEEGLIEQISKKSEVSKETLSELFKLLELRKHSNTTAGELIKLHKAIEKFNNIKK
jgi:hypothetical protein